MQCSLDRLPEEIQQFATTPLEMYYMMYGIPGEMKAEGFHRLFKSLPKGGNTSISEMLENSWEELEKMIGRENLPRANHARYFKPGEAAQHVFYKTFVIQLGKMVMDYYDPLGFGEVDNLRE